MQDRTKHIAALGIVSAIVIASIAYVLLSRDAHTSIVNTNPPIVVTPPGKNSTLIWPPALDCDKPGHGRPWCRFDDWRIPPGLNKTHERRDA